MERTSCDLGLSTGDRQHALAVRKQLELFPVESDFPARHFDAIASLVQRCVYRAVNADTRQKQLDVEQHIRRQLLASGFTPLTARPEQKNPRRRYPSQRFPPG